MGQRRGTSGAAAAPSALHCNRLLLLLLLLLSLLLAAETYHTGNSLPDPCALINDLTSAPRRLPGTLHTARAAARLEPAAPRGARRGGTMIADRSCSIWISSRGMHSEEQLVKLFEPCGRVASVKASTCRMGWRLHGAGGGGRCGFHVRAMPAACFGAARSHWRVPGAQTWGARMQA
jgi:hypothetical protein